MFLFSVNGESADSTLVEGFNIIRPYRGIYYMVKPKVVVQDADSESAFTAVAGPDPRDVYKNRLAAERAKSQDSKHSEKKNDSRTHVQQAVAFVDACRIGTTGKVVADLVSGSKASNLWPHEEIRKDDISYKFDISVFQGLVSLKEQYWNFLEKALCAAAVSKDGEKSPVRAEETAVQKEVRRMKEEIDRISSIPRAKRTEKESDELEDLLRKFAELSL